jgi:hypothetical protein
MLQTQVNYWNYVETKRHNYATEEANLMQAKAALSQAESAARNADTNAYNALINRENAESNRMNALTNQYNADINALNAEIYGKSVKSQNLLNDQRRVTEATQQAVNLAQESYTKQLKDESKAKQQSSEATAAKVRTETQWIDTSQRQSVAESKSKTFSNITSGISNLLNIMDKLVPNVSIDKWK